MKIAIKNDVFNIFKRIKQINNNFYIIFDTNKNKYEIYEKNNPCVLFTLPYESLDASAVSYVLKMLKTSNEEILKEIEEHNSKLEREENEKIIYSALNCAERELKRS